MPIDPKLAALVDAGKIEEFEGTWLNAAADALERRASAPNNKKQAQKIAPRTRCDFFIFCLGLSRWNSCRSSPECKRWACPCRRCRSSGRRASRSGRSGGGRRALGHHVADQALAGLLADALFDGFLQRLALEIAEVIVGEVLELQLVRRADKALGVAGETTGSASSQILPTGSLNAPSP